MIKVSKNCKFNPKQLKMGTAIEMEHTNSRKRAQHIAKQHLCEFPNYYTALKKMEAQLSRQKRLREAKKK